MKKVCAFFPCLSGRKQLAVALSFCVCAGFGAQHPAAALDASTRFFARDNLIIRIADNKSEAQCKAWHEKALAGQWFTEADMSAFFEMDGHEEAFVRRDSVILTGQGQVGLGRLPDKESPQTIHFACESD